MIFHISNTDLHENTFTKFISCLLNINLINKLNTLLRSTSSQGYFIHTSSIIIIFFLFHLRFNYLHILGVTYCSIYVGYIFFHGVLLIFLALPRLYNKYLVKETKIKIHVINSILRINWQEYYCCTTYNNSLNSIYIVTLFFLSS